MKFVTSHEYTPRKIKNKCLYSVNSHCHNQSIYLYLLICIFNKEQHSCLANLSWSTLVEGNLQLMQCGNILALAAHYSFKTIAYSIANGKKKIGYQRVQLAMLDHFEIIKSLQSIIHRWKGLLLRYIMVSVV